MRRGDAVALVQDLAPSPHTLWRRTTLESYEIMVSVARHSTVQIAGANGQISLGKQFAGRHVLVEQREPGVWMVRLATGVPDNERWLYSPKAAADLQAALAWAAAHPAKGER